MAKVQQMHLHRHTVTESSSGKYARKFEDANFRRPPLVPRMTSASRNAPQEDLVDSSSDHNDGGAYYVDSGLTLSNNASSDTDSVEFVK